MLDGGTPESTILYINFEDDRLMPLNEHKLAKLVDAFYRIYPENHEKKCYMFFDEVQNVDNWPIVIRRLHDTKNAEIFLTGSSSKLLSTEDNLTKIFNNYLSEGGFPEIISFSPDIKQKTLQEYLDVTIYRDIIERHNIKNPNLIKYMILSMIKNIGKPFSVNKFYNALKSQRYQISKDILYEYVNHIEDAYLAFPVALYDKSLRKIYTNPKKLYAIDPGLIRALTLDYENDLGRLFENIIYLDLRRLGYNINYYLTSERYEIDFLAQTPRGDKKLLQIAWDVEDSRTKKWEERALEAAKKELNIEGRIITLDSYLRDGLKDFERQL